MFILLVSNYILGQSFCFTTPNTSSGGRLGPPSSGTPTQSCLIYTIDIFFHRVVGNNFGYSSSINSAILANLNNSYNQYGFHFRQVGDRAWDQLTYSNPNTPEIAFLGLPDASGANIVSDAVNIYVVPANSSFKSGFVPSNYRNVIVVGGIRPVTACSGGTINYEIPTSRVVCHEMGHCFGLLHTFQDNGDDGLSDTTIDYNNLSNTCVNPSTCQFINNCGGPCPATNPTTTMTNFMSYTVPTCMSVFSPMQVNLMRYNLNNSMAYVASKTEGAPNMQLMKFDNQLTVYTLNSVNSGFHNIYTNLDADKLSSNISWAANTSLLYPSGTKNINAGFVVNSGQSITLNIVATNLCGTSSRNPTFTTYYGYSFSTIGKNTIAIKFDATERKELLPYHLSVYDETTMAKELEIDLTDLIFSKKIEENKLEINIEGIKHGTKIFKFLYRSLSADQKEPVSKTSRLLIH